MTRCVWLALTAVVACAVLPGSSTAAGGTYDVVFCHELHRLFERIKLVAVDGGLSRREPLAGFGHGYS